MLKLHFAPNSRAGRILWLLEELELLYELNKMAFSPTDLKSDEHRARHHFAKYLQWFHYCEGMVMPPMNTIVVHTVLLPPERRDETVLGQAQRLLNNALKPVNENLEGKDYLIGDFSGADIMLGHSCFMSNRLGCVSDDMSNIKAYVERLESRPAFKKAIETQ